MTLDILYTPPAATGPIGASCDRVRSGLMTEQTLEIRLLETADEMAPIVTMFQQVWGSVIPLVGVELLRAIGHSGGYVAGAFDSGRIVGASVAFLARHQGEEALHSHVTGILPGVTGSGVGRAMKNHQRAWAAEQGLKWVTWTFDPLVRRNAWFNIEVLRAHVADYLVDFYGPMTDSINARDESDRLMVAWPTDPTTMIVRTFPGELPIEVPTPEDIVALRRTDPAAARDWRLHIREELGERMKRGAIVTGFTRAGSYIVRDSIVGDDSVKAGELA
jgi:predicted GNAT superfamily acetyltransferase